MENTPITIAGIGTSAGGLKALEEFFTYVPNKSNFAFIVVQHLVPNRECILHELLQKCTSIPVSQITDSVRAQPNHIYIIPPNRNLSLSQGHLTLSELKKSQGLKLPIDHFFMSLAKDLGANAIGIVFSGMGSDGMLGLEAIKKGGGLCIVQDPKTASYDSMPLSAIDAKLAHIVASPKQLGQNIEKYVSQFKVSSPLKTHSVSANESSTALDKIFQILHKRTGNDFSMYKASTVSRRIDRRLSLHNIDSLELYADFLIENNQEVDLLFKENLIGVTHFFRDPQVWEQFISEVLPNLLNASGGKKQFRAWVPACSTGEEAYTLAIAFQECLKSLDYTAGYSLQIFATDPDNTASINIMRKLGMKYVKTYTHQDTLGDGYVAYLI